MSPIRVDFSQARNAIEVGPRRIVITDGEVKDSQSSPFPYIKWTAVVDEGEADAGYKLRFNTSLNPSAAWKLKEFLEAVGEEIGDAKEMEIEITDIIGRSCIAIVEQDTYEGQIRNTVDSFRPA